MKVNQKMLRGLLFYIKDKSKTPFPARLIRSRMLREEFGKSSQNLNECGEKVQGTNC